MSDGRFIRYGDEGEVVRITLARPPLNILTIAMMETLNAALADRPELVNQSPYGEGWMLRVRLNDAGELDRLLSAQEYDEFVAQGAG